MFAHTFNLRYDKVIWNELNWGASTSWQSKFQGRHAGLMSVRKPALDESYGWSRLTPTQSVTPMEVRRRARLWGATLAVTLAAAVVAVVFGLVGAGRASAAALAGSAPLTAASGAPGSGQVSAGAGYACAIRWNGTVACWGADDYGLSRPPSGTFTQVSAGRLHACGIRTGGHVACWGVNDHGSQLPRRAPSLRWRQVMTIAARSAPTGGWSAGERTPTASRTRRRARSFR